MSDMKSKTVEERKKMETVGGGDEKEERCEIKEA